MSDVLYVLEFLVNFFELSMQAIQVGAARVLSSLLIVADYLQQYFGNACFGLDDKQVFHFVSLLPSFFVEFNWLDELFLYYFD